MPKLLVLLSVTLTACLTAAEHPFTVDQLRDDHPKILASEADFERIRNGFPDKLGQEMLSFLQITGEELLTAEPAQYKLAGMRLLNESRLALKHISTFALLYRVYGEDRYKDKMIEYLDHVTSFPNWNPQHYLDIGEMTLAVAIGVDWLWQDLNREQQDRYLTAIIEKGIHPSLDESAETNWWMYYNNNWNPVCHAGLTAGAILIADRNPELAELIINRALTAVPIAMAETDPDGIYPEGPTYWAYGTEFSILFMDLLERAVGHTFDLKDNESFKKSIGFRTMAVAPTGASYNFFDSGSYIYHSPGPTWFAKTYNTPVAHYEYRRQLASFLSSDEWTPDNNRNRLFPFTVLWYPENARAVDPSEMDLPTTWWGNGTNPVAMIKSAWGEPDAFFVGFKGGLGSISHAHMDAGSFIYEDSGVRWAVDLGAQTYLTLESKNIGLWDRRQLSDRWRIFRLGPYSHNLLLIDEQLHQVDEQASITHFQETDTEITGTVDLSAVNRNQVESYKRSFTIHDLKVLQIDDHILGARKPFEHEGRNSATLHWRMVTKADVQIEGDSAILKQDGKTCHLKVILPQNVPFTLHARPLDPPPYFYDEPNPGHTAIDLWLQADPDGNRNIRVLLSTDLDALKATQ